MINEEQQARQVWRSAALRLARENLAIYQQYFAHIRPLACVDFTLTLGVSDNFFADMIIRFYQDLLENSLRDLSGVTYNYSFVSGYSAPAEPTLSAAEISAITSETSVPAPAKPVAPAAPVAGRSVEFTFTNFIVGEENRHAFAAAKSVAESPGIYNPLFIYGTNGVGKTHLLHAVEHAVHQLHPQMVVRAITCDELLNQFYELLYQKKSMVEFRSSVRDVDLLLVDDIHRLEKKPQIQEEFFNLFNTLYDQGKQIILTSDRQPCEMADVSKRLTTRFESGMLSEIYMPEYEARLAILRLWRQDIVTTNPLSDDILDFLASRITSSVRRLRGCFVQLAAMGDFGGQDRLTRERAEEILQRQLGDEMAVHALSLEEIQQKVAAHFSLTLPELVGSCRASKFAVPRIAAMALCRELTGCSTTEIGAAFGKTHATIISATNRLPDLCRRDAMLRTSIEQIRRELKRAK